ncbi:hypothetical protein VUR80DRAFT_2204 [Thermomyces stellatus]
MPFRIPSRAPATGARGSLRTFTTTPRLATFHEPTDSHYDVLKVRPEASEAEIKKSFYALSKLHHPDRNPSDPHAPKRFIRISEAYAVLSAPAKRAAYDRELRSSHNHPNRGPHYHTPTNPAGGRPPSGLSRRRTNSTRGTFRGPPNSFYERGGYGAYAEKRRAAHEESTGMGGMGFGQDPFHRAHAPHFDRHSHERTHRRQDERRASRAAPPGPEGDKGGSFGFALVIGGMLFCAGYVPYVFHGGLSEPKSRQSRS